MEKYSEKWLELRLKHEVKKKGGLALKWVSPGNNGVPDRIVLMPGNRAYFVELKSTGQDMKPLQKVWRRMLTNLGFKHFLIDDKESLINFLKFIDIDI